MHSPYLSLNRLIHNSRHVSGFCNFKTYFPRSKANKKFSCINRAFSSSNSSNKSVSSGNWKRNGTPEIIIGTTILTMLLVDTMIQKYNDSSPSISKETVLRQLELAIEKDEMTKHKSTNLANTIHPLLDLNGKEKATLYKCQIMKTPKYFDGTRSLKNVKVNDVVEVVQEFVGPDSNYHLCKIEKKGKKEETSSKPTSIKAKNTIIENMESRYEYGWFPITCLKNL